MKKQTESFDMTMRKCTFSAFGKGEVLILVGRWQACKKPSLNLLWHGDSAVEGQ